MNDKAAGPEVTRLIELMAKLPGLGPRSARRAALHLIKNRERLMIPLAEAMAQAADKIVICPQCGNIDTLSPCAICQDAGRDQALICVVEEVGDLWALERAGVMRARYHVLGGTLSPLDGIGPDDLNIAKLIERASQEHVKEVLLALNATVEGRSTVHLLTEELEPAEVTVARLSHGVPVGGELEYLDEGTWTAAIKSRKIL